MKSLLQFFLFTHLMQCNCKIICFYKIAPVAIFFATTCIKFPVLNFLPYCINLFFNRCDVLRCYDYFSFFIIFLFIGLNKIKFSAHYLPFFMLIIINEYLIKYSLAPVITAIRFFITRRQ